MKSIFQQINQICLIIIQREMRQHQTKYSKLCKSDLIIHPCHHNSILLLIVNLKIIRKILEKDQGSTDRLVNFHVRGSLVRILQQVSIEVIKSLWFNWDWVLQACKHQRKNHLLWNILPSVPTLTIVHLWRHSLIYFEQ